MSTRRKRYSNEFKREALKRASEEGMTDVRVCEELNQAFTYKRFYYLLRKFVMEYVCDS